MSKIDQLYAREILSLTFVIVAAVSSVMFVFRIFAYADYVFLSGNGIATLILFIVFLFPQIFKLTIPVSLLLASVMVTLRMSQDREIEALMSTGASVWRIARAPSILGVLAMIVSLYTGLFLEPISREQLGRFKWMQTVNGIENFVDSKLDEKTFLTDIFPLENLDVSLYVDRMKEEKGAFQGVLLSVRNPQSPRHDEMILVAKEGYIRKEDEGGFPDYVFSAQDGRIYQPSFQEGEGGGLYPGFSAGPAAQGIAEGDEDTLTRSRRVSAPERERVFLGPLPLEASQQMASAGSWDVFQFSTMRLSIFSLFRHQTASRSDNEVEIRTLGPFDYIRELRKRRNSPDWGTNQRYVRDHTYFYDAATVPLTCVFLPVIGICLGIADPRRRPGKAYLGMGVVMLLYFSISSICQQLALRFVVPPEMTLWVPPLVITLLTLWLVRIRTIYPPATTFREMVTLDYRCLSQAVSRHSARFLKGKSS